MSRVASRSFFAVVCGCSFRVLACGALLVARTGPSAAQAAAPVRNPANGHFYEPVMTYGASRTFAAALAGAAAKSHLGVQGHLVTITSQEEQTFLEHTFFGFLAGPYWMGASDAAVNGEWRWVTGPEAGQLFWKTTNITPEYTIEGVASGFESWLRDPQNGSYWEPNDLHSETEDYATFYLGGGRSNPPPYYRTTYWNELPGESSRFFNLGQFVSGYMIEYSVPEPSCAIIAVVGTAALPLRRRRGKQTHRA